MVHQCKGLVSVPLQAKREREREGKKWSGQGSGRKCDYMSLLEHMALKSLVSHNCYYDAFYIVEHT